LPLALSISLSGYTRPLKARAWFLICSIKRTSRGSDFSGSLSQREKNPAEEIVKGYEVEKNQYVILADEELREVAPEKSTGIEIQEFVNEAEISSLYFEKPYYLEPDKGAGKAFALLREALMKTGKVGITQFVLRNRDSLCMLKPHGQGLVVNALRCQPNPVHGRALPLVKVAIATPPIENAGYVG
jgi:hypothetical protein